MANKIEDVSMQYAENGVVVSYCEIAKKETKGAYDNCLRDYKKEVFEDLEKGFDRFKVLFLQAKKD